MILPRERQFEPAPFPVVTVVVVPLLEVPQGPLRGCFDEIKRRGRRRHSANVTRNDSFGLCPMPEAFRSVSESRQDGLFFVLHQLPLLGWLKEPIFRVVGVVARSTETDLDYIKGLRRTALPKDCICV